jgi:hypothetical protein
VVGETVRHRGVPPELRLHGDRLAVDHFLGRLHDERLALARLDAEVVVGLPHPRAPPVRLEQELRDGDRRERRRVVRDAAGARLGRVDGGLKRLLLPRFEIRVLRLHDHRHTNTS